MSGNWGRWAPIMADAIMPQEPARAHGQPRGAAVLLAHPDRGLRGGETGLQYSCREAVKPRSLKKR